jgi:hypothetical protein
MVSASLESDRVHEFVEVIDNALVKLVQLRPLLLLQFRASA